MKTLLYTDLKKLFLSSLSALYDERECSAIFHFYLENRLHIVKTAFYTEPRKALSAEEFSFLENDLFRMSQGEPVQYICGKAFFYGLPFYVNPSVLIPRPETEELVELILQENGGKQGLKITDIGTGSGSIAVTLSKYMPSARITALDISADAIATAKMNASYHETDIDFLRFDILNDDPGPVFTDTDILVSNPPYIPEKRKMSLHPNVKYHEPHEALFVPDDDPLIFYRRIAAIGRSFLRPSGTIYLETYEEYHAALRQLFAEHGFESVAGIEDINGKPRIMVCRQN